MGAMEQGTLSSTENLIRDGVAEHVSLQSRHPNTMNNGVNPVKAFDNVPTDTKQDGIHASHEGESKPVMTGVEEEVEDDRDDPPDSVAASSSAAMKDPEAPAKKKKKRKSKAQVSL